MNQGEKHIILIGFKNTGKSTIGRLLSKKFNKPWVDLDHEIEKNYYQESQKKISCREIVRQNGEAFFRDLETKALTEIIRLPSAVISLGGGAVTRKENQTLVKPHFLIHITADPSIVYERMMTEGKPAYFPEEQGPREFFDFLWKKSEKIYRELSNITVSSTNRSVDETVRDCEDKVRMII